MSLITVREFAKLTTATCAATLDRATISPADFAWLADAQQSENAPRLLRVDGRNSLSVMNYVGVIRTPSGSEIEILPKYIADTNGVPEARRILLQMISRSLGINPRAADEASLEVLRRPFTDWMAQLFLRETARLISKGLRQEYQRVEGRERYLRGRLDVARQLRAGPTSASSFNIQHDEFVIDRPENRLIKTAVEVIARSTTVPSTLQLATELQHLLREVPVSSSVKSDLSLWRSDRLTAHYQPTREPCRLILTGQTPFSVRGESLAQSMLFPMERLFEDFVARTIRSALPAEYQIRRQPRTHKLCSYLHKEWFELRPDLQIDGHGQTWILDAKWKILNSDPQDRYGLSQADLYQLNAYGQTYLGGKGDLYLVYPLTNGSPKLSEPLHLKPDLRIHIRVIDLATGDLDLTTMHPLLEPRGYSPAADSAG